jgi:O-antigen/teichoic acid export membrane protein
MVRKLVFSAYASNIATYYTATLPTIMLGITSSANELGYFSLARLIVDFGALIPGVIATYALPLLMTEQVRIKYKQTLWHILILAATSMVLTTFPIAYFSDVIVDFLFGSDFIPSGKCLHTMSLGIFAAGMVMVIQAIIASQQHETLLVLNAFMLAFFMTALTFVFYGHLNSQTMSWIYSGGYLFGMVFSLLTLAYVSYSGRHSRIK